MAKEYIQSMATRTARPRSERLRRLGGAIVSTEFAVVSGAGSSAAGYFSGSTHEHTNLIDLNQISIEDGYIYLTDTVQDENGNDVTVTEKVKAGYADMARTNADGNELDWFIPQSDGSLKLNPKYNGLYADGFMTGGGKGTSSGGCGSGLISTVYGADSFGGTFDRADNTSTFNAYAINSLYGAYITLRDTVNNLSGQTGGTEVSWGTTASGVSPLTVDGTTKTVVLSEALDSYASREWVNNQGFLKSYEEQYKGTVTGIQLGLSGEVYAPYNGTVLLPAYPTALKNPYSLTFGSKTYDGSAARTITAADLGALTEHQSLANYVTLDGTQTISGAKTFTATTSVHAYLYTYGIIPEVNQKYDLGSVDYQWRYINTKEICFGGGAWFVGDVDGTFKISKGETWITPLAIDPSTGAATFLSSVSAANANLTENLTLGGCINFVNATSGKKDSLVGGGYGYLYFRTGADINEAYKQITFHKDYGFYPETSGINLGYDGANYRWATIYGVAGNFSGDLSVTGSVTTESIKIGPVTIEYNATTKCLYIHGTDGGTNIGIYTDGPNTGGGRIA